MCAGRRRRFEISVRLLKWLMMIWTHIASSPPTVEPMITPLPSASLTRAGTVVDPILATASEPGSPRPPRNHTRFQAQEAAVGHEDAQRHP